MSEDQKTTGHNEESKDVISDYYEGVKQLEIAGYESGIRKARNTLFITAALLFIGEMISAAVSEIPFTLVFWIIVLVECGIFVALAFWTRTRPYSAIIVGLVVFILLWILGVVLGGLETAFKGILFKIIVIIFLVKAIPPAKAWEEAKRNS
jgi:hypothetical protein